MSGKREIARQFIGAQQVLWMFMFYKNLAFECSNVQNGVEKALYLSTETTRDWKKVECQLSYSVAQPTL